MAASRAPPSRGPCSQHRVPFFSASPSLFPAVSSSPGRGARPSAISTPELVLQLAPWRSASPPCPSAIGSPSSFNDLAVGLVSVQAAIAPCRHL
ncbi:hypothetical protein Zm00014a_011762 [Zea mays]|uniref:Uncharacterized protein n=1 Tax=Zea mays TaxID=4577 RepID=A0A3L6DHW1_MAIZE|nr:hypothetical protein Zm00014a_011762 [Zea mays]